MNKPQWMLHSWDLKFKSDNLKVSLKTYWTDYHCTWWKDVFLARKEPITFRISQFVLLDFTLLKYQKQHSVGESFLPFREASTVANFLFGELLRTRLPFFNFHNCVVLAILRFNHTVNEQYGEFWLRGECREADSLYLLWESTHCIYIDVSFISCYFFLSSTTCPFSASHYHSVSYLPLRQSVIVLLSNLLGGVESDCSQLLLNI